MSSEMREVDAFEAWARAQCFGAEELRRIEGRPANTFGLTWEYNGDSVQAAWAAWLERALLARTEAGADGAVAPADLARWLTEKLLSFDENRYRRELDTLHLRMAFAALPPLYTHPQDASGDAENAARWRHVRQDGLIWRVNMLALAKDDIDILFDAKADAAVDDAMQAKEGK